MRLTNETWLSGQKIHWLYSQTWGASKEWCIPLSLRSFAIPSNRICRFGSLGHLPGEDFECLASFRRVYSWFYLACCGLGLWEGRGFSFVSLALLDTFLSFSSLYAYH